jgi:predicted nucleic acid-binding protein
MLRWGRKYALDTNVFIQAFRDEARKAELQRFRSAFAPFEHLSAVVVQELRAGARSVQAATRLQRHVFDALERRGRVFAPTYASWKRAGEALARLSVLDGTPLRTFGRTFVNDVLLAASCREAGIVLVSNSSRDFARIQRVLPFEFVPVWRDANGGER